MGGLQNKFRFVCEPACVCVCEHVSESPWYLLGTTVSSQVAQW